MELAFASKELRDICESEVLSYQEFDTNVARCLISRLADLRAVDKVNEMPIGSPDRLIRDGEEYFKIELTDGFMIILTANHTNNPKLDNDAIDWDNVSRIKICQIEGQNV